MDLAAFVCGPTPISSYSPRCPPDRCGGAGWLRGGHTLAALTRADSSAPPATLSWTKRSYLCPKALPAEHESAQTCSAAGIARPWPELNSPAPRHRTLEDACRLPMRTRCCWSTRNSARSSRADTTLQAWSECPLTQYPPVVAPCDGRRAACGGGDLRQREERAGLACG
eukprot:5071579-Prymnesium_polylepis.1